MPRPDIVIAPTQGNIYVLSVTTSASSEQDIGIDEADKSQYWTFVCDVDCYVTFGGSTVTDPDETTASGDGRTWLLSAGQPQAFVLDRGSRYFKAKGSASGKLRYYAS